MGIIINQGEYTLFTVERGEEVSIIRARVGGVETVRPIIMLIEQIVLNVIEPGSAPGTRERTHQDVYKRQGLQKIEVGDSNCWVKRLS